MPAPHLPSALVAGARGIACPIRPIAPNTRLGGAAPTALGRNKKQTGPLLSFHRHDSGGDRREFCGVAEFGQTLDQALLLDLVGAPIEIVAAKVLVHRSILEHVIDGGEH